MLVLDRRRSARSSRSARPASSCGPRSSQFGGWIDRRHGDRRDQARGARRKAGAPFYFGINASPALLSVGYIVGFNVAARDLRRRGAQPLDRGAAVLDVRRSRRASIVDPDTRTIDARAARSSALDRARRRRRDPRRASRATSASAACSSAACGRCSSCASRCSAASPPASTPTRSARPAAATRAAHRARHADEHHPDPDRRVGRSRCSSSSGTSPTRRRSAP